MRKALARNMRLQALDDLFIESGKIGYAVMWLIGIPLPIVLLLYVIFK